MAAGFQARLLPHLGAIMPHAAFDAVASTAGELLRDRGGGKLSFGLLVSLWLASSGMEAAIEGLNVAFQAPKPGLGGAAAWSPSASPSTSLFWWAARSGSSWLAASSPASSRTSPASLTSGPGRGAWLAGSPSSRPSSSPSSSSSGQTSGLRVRTASSCPLPSCRCSAGSPRPPGSAFKKKSIQKGDLLVSINGQPITTVYLIHEVLRQTEGKAVTLVNRRAGKHLTATTEPHLSDQGGPQL